MEVVNLYFPELQIAQEFAKKYELKIVYNDKIKKWQCEKNMRIFSKKKAITLDLKQDTQNF